MKTSKKTQNPALEAAVATGKSVNTKTKKTVKPETKKASTEKEVATKITAESVASNREVKYIYPEGVRKDREASKKFRAGVRRKVASFESALEKLKGSKLPEDVQLYATKFAEFEAYKTEVYPNYEVKTLEAKAPTVKKRKKVLASA